MAKTPMKNSPFSGLMKQVDWGMKNSRGGIGGMAAMLGVPFQQKRGGNWMTIDPRSQSVYLSGTTPPNGISGGGPQIEDPALPPFDPNDPNGDGSGSGKFAWTFPQYSQSWAFTPPEPTPYPYPQRFDPKKYGDPFKK